jgi:hypothetical protein
MYIGNVVKIKSYPWSGWRATVIDDCYRKTDTRYTMLVQLISNPDMELEIDLEDVDIYG